MQGERTRRNMYDRGNMPHSANPSALPLARTMPHRERLRTRVETLLARADIRTDGQRERDIRVHDARFFQRVIADGDLGFGESYMDGDWDCDRLDELTARIFSAELDRLAIRPSDVINALLARAATRQTRHRVRRHVAPHYDLGN